jgi:hypothetical protein
MSVGNLSEMFNVIEQDGCKIIVLRGAANPALTVETAPTSSDVANSSCSEPDLLIKTMRELAAARATIRRIQRETEDLRKGMEGISRSLQPDALLSSL